mgnify:CR=1 FL=1
MSDLSRTLLPTCASQSHFLGVEFEQACKGKESYPVCAVCVTPLARLPVEQFQSTEHCLYVSLFVYKSWSSFAGMHFA